MPNGALLSLLVLCLPAAVMADSIPANDLPLRFGADSEGQTRFVGEMACARLYGRALTPKEVDAIAAAGPAGSSNVRGILAEWRLGQPSGGVYRSRVARGLDARVVGGVGAAAVGGIGTAQLGDGYLEVAADARLNLRRAMTVEAWVRPGMQPAQGGRILDRITAGGSNGWLLDTYPGNSLRFVCGDAKVQVEGCLPAGPWAHIVATAAPDGALALYLNGKRLAGRDEATDGVAYRGRPRGPGSPLALWYRRPARRWTEAMVLGNGRIGAMAYGGVRQERFALNEDTLWSGEPGDTLPKEAARYVPEVRRLLLAGRNRQAHDLAAAKLLGPYFQSYLPLGDLTLDFGDVKQVGGYRRELDLATGVARVTYRVGDATFTREAFVSHPAQALVVRLTCDRPRGISCVASLASQLHGKAHPDGGDLVFEGRAPKWLDAYTGRPAEWDDAPGGGGMRFAVRVHAIADGGSAHADGDVLRIDHANSATLVLTAATSYNGFQKSPSREGRDPGVACQAQSAALYAKPYASLRAEHVADFGALMGRVSLDLGRQRAAAMPTDERVRGYEPGKDPGLAALHFQFGRYLLASGSRPGTQPLNLQGIWNDRLVPPWASNWTLNCNAEINYWPAEVANLGECHLPLIQLAQDISVDGARVAWEMYGASGWMTHHNADLWRRATPVSGDPLWAIFQVGGAWLCQHAWEHYAFSGDTEYLRGVWPTLKGAARYFLDTMLEEPTHHWLVDAPATNFESYFRKPDGETAAVCMGPTADMQMIRELFGNCVKASRVLRVDSGFRAEIEQALPRLAPMQVSPRTGELQEWVEDWDHANPRNGQILSLWGLICGTQITPRSTPALARALRKSLDDRKPWNTWVGSWTGAFASNGFARLGDGDAAAMVLDRHLGKVVNPNLTAGFEGMAEWQIDGNMGQTAAIAEMLLQSHTSEIELLPALPKAWSAGRVSGLRARGGFTVGMTWKDGRLVSAAVTSLIGGSCRVRYRDMVVAIATARGVTYRLDGELRDLRR